jgi:ATP-dependent DNA helicase DinG
MLTETIKQEIQQAYRRFLDSKGWQARHGQKQMIAEIARVLGHIECDADGKRRGNANHLCIIEAGTGTGKTVAYCLAAIPVAKALKKTLVISTATVALQEQIVYKDLPDLRRQSGLDFDFALAKGRARYLCPAKLDTQLEGLGMAAGPALYPDEIPAENSAATQALFEQMASEMAAGRWDGDKDAWPKQVEAADWFKVTTDHRQCAGRRCAYIAQCPFFKARDQVQGVDVVVANHDLLLADLALGGGAILPAPEQCIYILDEGHHLADKAIAHFACHTRIAGSQKFFRQADKTIAAMAKALGNALAGTAVQLEKISDHSHDLQAALAQWSVMTHEQVPFAETERVEKNRNFSRRSRIPASRPMPQRYRFPQGAVPEAFRQHARILHHSASRLQELLSEVADQLKQALDGSSEIPRHLLEQWYPAIGLMQSRAENQEKVWHCFAMADDSAKPPLARWVTAHDDQGEQDFEWCCSPIQASQDLEQKLWQRCFAAVVTSATLTALNSFERFRLQSGVENTAHCVAIRSPFDFRRAIFSVPALGVEPTDTEAHTQAVVTFLQNNLPAQRGNLVLFASHRQMEDVFYALDREQQKNILLQGDLSKQEMIAEHRKRIDAGQGSTLFGLASFAEGIDLPGAYCEHVIMAKLPFAAPDDPVEEAMAEWIEKNGGNAFMQIAVPDAAMKLVQACGRLLRNEKDSGRITLLDRRIVTKRYGKLLLDSLPPYTMEIAG